MQNISLLSVKHSNRFLAIHDKELILVTKAAVWSIIRYSSCWILANEGSSLRVIFSNKRQRHRSVQVTDDPHRLILRASIKMTPTNGHFGLELLLENPLEGTVFPIFFLSIRDQQILQRIDHRCFERNVIPVDILTVPDDCHYDYVVIGSSFCALAFIHRILENNPNAKILVLEKGFKYLSKHRQSGYSHALPGEVEVRPWSIAAQTLAEGVIENVHGQIPLFGGRSTYWSGWSPTPSTKEMVGWPEQLRISLETTYFALAREFLGVVEANNINARHNGTRAYAAFQSSLKKCLNSADSVESVEQVLHAPLAMNTDQ